MGLGVVRHDEVVQRAVDQPHNDWRMWIAFGEQQSHIAPDVHGSDAQGCHGDQRLAGRVFRVINQWLSLAVDTGDRTDDYFARRDGGE